MIIVSFRLFICLLCHQIHTLLTAAPFKMPKQQLDAITVILCERDYGQIDSALGWASVSFLG